MTADEFVKLFAPAWKQAVVSRLVPSRIQTYRSLSFIPRDPPFPTRTVGSWIGVCVSGSVLLVNAWAQHLMRPYQTGVKPVHTWYGLDHAVCECVCWGRLLLIIGSDVAV